jgi:hypothetical protein
VPAPRRACRQRCGRGWGVLRSSKESLRSDFQLIKVSHSGVKQEIASGLNLAINLQKAYRRFQGR